MPFCVSCGDNLLGRFCAKCGQDSIYAKGVDGAAGTDTLGSAAGADPSGSAAGASMSCTNLPSAPAAILSPASTVAGTGAGRGQGISHGPGKPSLMKPSAVSSSVQQSWRNGPLGGFLFARNAAVGSVSGVDAGQHDVQGARAVRDAAHTSTVSAKIRAQQQERTAMTARSDLAKSFFTRQFKIRGGSGFGYGTGGGRPRKNDKTLQDRVNVLAQEYGADVGEFKDLSPFDWWEQSPKVKALYEDRMWSREIEPQGEEDGIRVDGKVSSSDAIGHETWEEEGQTKYFQNDLIKELLRSCWYEWTPSGKFIRLKSVAQWRVACLSKFGTSGPGRTQAFKWRQKEDERVKAWTENKEKPGEKTAFKAPPNVVEMVKEIDKVRDEAKKMTTTQEPGRPRLLHPDLYQDLKDVVAKKKNLLGFSAATVKLAAYALLKDKLEADSDEDLWMPSDGWAYWYLRASCCEEFVRMCLRVCVPTYVRVFLGI